MPVPGTCTNCKYLEGKTYGGNLLVCGMHPYGPSGDACDDFEKDLTFKSSSLESPSSPAINRIALAQLIEAIARLELRHHHRQHAEMLHVSAFVLSPFNPSIVIGLRVLHPSPAASRTQCTTTKSAEEWQAMVDTEELHDWIEYWLHHQIHNNLDLSPPRFDLHLPEPVESNRPGGEEEAFWQDIRSALALCFPGSGEWSCRKVEREYLPDNLYEFETRSPSGELVRFRVSARSVFCQEDLLHELVRGIRESAARTREAGRFLFLFEDGLTETEDEEEWLYSRLHAVLRRCFPWAERWSIGKGLMFGGNSFEFSSYQTLILLACHERSKEQKLESLSRSIEREANELRDRPQFRHLFEPPSGGRILPPATIVRPTFDRPIPGTDRGYCDN